MRYMPVMFFSRTGFNTSTLVNREVNAPRNYLQICIHAARARCLLCRVEEFLLVLTHTQTRLLQSWNFLSFFHLCVDD